MANQADIEFTAAALLRNHGEKAPMECALMAERCQRRGELDGAELWLNVMEAVRVMQKGPQH